METNTQVKENLKKMWVSFTLLIYLIIANSFVVYKVWNWFAPIVHKNAYAIDFKQAVAVFAIVTFIKRSPMDNIKKEFREDVSTTNKNRIVSPVLVLCIAYIIYKVLTCF